MKKIQVVFVGIITGAMLFLVAAAASYNKTVISDRLNAIAASPSALMLAE